MKIYFLFLPINNAQEENPITDCALLSLWINIGGFITMDKYRWFWQSGSFSCFQSLTYNCNFILLEGKGQRK